MAWAGSGLTRCSAADGSALDDGLQITTKLDPTTDVWQEGTTEFQNKIGNRFATYALQQLSVLELLE